MTLCRPGGAPLKYKKYLDRNDAADEHDDVAEYVVRIEQKGERVGDMGYDEFQEEQADCQPQDEVERQGLQTTGQLLHCHPVNKVEKCQFRCLFSVVKGSPQTILEGSFLG